MISVVSTVIRIPGICMVVVSPILQNFLLHDYYTQIVEHFCSILKIAIAKGLYFPKYYSSAAISWLLYRCLITDKTKIEESRATMSCSEFLELNTACMVVHMVV